jgi:hypothetical protein
MRASNRSVRRSSRNKGEGTGTVPDQHVARSELGDRVERHQEVLLVVELLADEPFRLSLVRRHEPRLRFDTEP